MFQRYRETSRTVAEYFVYHLIYRTRSVRRRRNPIKCRDKHKQSTRFQASKAKLSEEPPCKTATHLYMRDTVDHRTLLYPLDEGVADAVVGYRHPQGVLRLHHLHLLRPAWKRALGVRQWKELLRDRRFLLEIGRWLSLKAFKVDTKHSCCTSLATDNVEVVILMKTVVLIDVYHVSGVFANRTKLLSLW